MLTGALAVVVGIVAATSYSSFEEPFHWLFFEGETWRFEETDTLRRLYPDRFWLDTAVVIGVLAVLQAAVVFLVARLWARRAGVRSRRGCAHGRRAREHGGRPFLAVSRARLAPRTVDSYRRDLEDFEGGSARMQHRRPASRSSSTWPSLRAAGRAGRRSRGGSRRCGPSTGTSSCSPSGPTTRRPKSPRRAGFAGCRGRSPPARPSG